MGGQFRNRHLLVAAALFCFLQGGCTKNENPLDSSGETELIPEKNLFPFASGRIWVFEGYSLDTLNSQKISATVHREVTSVRSTLSILGKTGYLVVDSVYTPTGGVSSVDTTYYAVDNGNLLVYYGDWITLFKRSSGLNTEYDAGQFVAFVLGIPLTVRVKATIFPKESVVTPLGTFQAYKLAVKSLTSLGGLSVELLQYVYFADNYGPVKFQDPVQRDPFTGAKIGGSESLLVNKNF